MGKATLPFTGIALALVAALPGRAEALGAERLAAKAQSLAQVLVSRQEALGLSSGTGFQPISGSTDETGGAHVRLQQTYKGVPVWRARAIGHTASDGTVRGFDTALAKGVSLDVNPSRTAEEAKSIALRNLGSSVIAQAAPTRASLVVMPNRHAGGFKFKRDASTHRIVLDEEASWPVSLSRSGYTLAYHVSVTYLDATAGKRSTQYLVDANTGAVMNRWDARRFVDGTGHSQYSGDVTLQTTYNSSSAKFQMVDPTRGSLVHPYYSSTFGLTGNQTAWLDASFGINTYLYASNTWGDGLNFVETNTGDSVNGQTAAVDAHYGAQVTWDMYKNVYGRDGIDDLGTSLASFVHLYIGQGYDNAFWDSGDFSMNYGDGTEFTTLTSLDVSAHEMSHGVMDSMAGLDYIGESGGLNEANSDIMGTMAEFYGKGGNYAAQASTIPDTGGNWTIGEDLSTTPLRFMYEPSLDGCSYDYWFGGVGSDDVHYSSGVGNHFFYYLSQGTASYPSTYLTAGMTGIGNQKAGLIWYGAMRDYVSSTSADYAAVRTATLAAASNRYGSTSTEYQAVANAWAAVNVGAAYGASDPIRVLFTNSFLSNDYWGDSTFVMLPLNASYTYKVSVSDSSSVTWSTGASGPMLSSDTDRLACSVTSGGVLTTPSALGSLAYGYDQVKAVSVSDATQYAATLVMVFDCDRDGDGSVDAFDMAKIAVNYGSTTNTGDVTGNGKVNDYDVSAFAQAFQNAFGQ